MPALAAPRSCSSAGTRCTRNRSIGVSASAWRWPLCSRTQRHSNGLAHRQTTVTLDLPTSTDKAADPLPGRPRPGLRPGLEDDLLARQVLWQGATVDRALPPALVDQGQAAAVPDQEVHPVGAFGPKHQDRTRNTRIAPQNGSSRSRCCATAASPSIPLRKSTGVVATSTWNRPAGRITRPPSGPQRPRWLSYGSG